MIADEVEQTDSDPGEAPFALEPSERLLAFQLLDQEGFLEWLESHGLVCDAFDVENKYSLPAGMLDYTPDGRSPLACPGSKAIIFLGDVWRGMVKTEARLNAEARAEAECQRIQAAFRRAEEETGKQKVAQDGEREARARQDRRAALTALLEDRAWRDGENLVSLRALVAWSRSEGVKLSVSEPSCNNLTKIAGKGFNEEIVTRER